MIPRRNHHRRSVHLRLSNRNLKLTIKHNIQKGQVHLYGIKIRYPQHGKDIRQLGVCRRRQNRTEQKARTTYDNILRLVKDPEVCDPIRFLREREIVHYQRFGESLRIVQDDLDSKNFYAINPEFDMRGNCNCK